MSIVDIYAERKTAQVMKETWGHLAPVTGTTYEGFILFAVTPLGNSLLLDFDFDGLDGNPWTMEHVSDWWSDTTEAPEYASGDESRFWRWEGRYKALKDGSARFTGEIVPMRLGRTLHSKDKP